MKKYGENKANVAIGACIVTKSPLFPVADHGANASVKQLGPFLGKADPLAIQGFIPMRKLVMAAVVGTAISLSACSKKEETTEDTAAMETADETANADAMGDQTATEAANTAAEVASEAGAAADAASQAAGAAADAAGKAADAASEVAQEAAQ